jgi:hypothetical protein
MELSQRGIQSKRSIETEAGIEFLLKIILAGNFPLVPSRHSFEIEDNIIKHSTFISTQRMQDLNEVLKDYTDSKKMDKLVYWNSNTDIDYLKPHPIFVLSDEVDTNALKFGRPAYTDEQEATSYLRPMGII